MKTKQSNYDIEMVEILTNSIEIHNEAVARAKEWYDIERKKRNDAKKRLLAYRKRYSKQ